MRHSSGTYASCGSAGAVLATGYAIALFALSAAVGAIGAESAGLAKLLAVTLPIPSIAGCFFINRNDRTAAVLLGGSAALYAAVVGWFALPVAVLLGGAAAMTAMAKEQDKDQPASTQSS